MSAAGPPRDPLDPTSPRPAVEPPEPAPRPPPAPPFTAPVPVGPSFERPPPALTEPVPARPPLAVPPAGAPEPAWAPPPPGSGSAAVHGVRWRVGGPAIVLLVLGSLLSVAAAGAWTYRSAVHSQRTWVDLFGPLHDDPTVARSVAAAFVEAVSSSPRAAVNPASRQQLADEVAQLIAQPDFASSWEAAIADAQAQAVALGSSSGPRQVVLHLQQLIERVQSEAATRGIDLGSIRSSEGDVVVVDIDHAPQVHRAFRLLDNGALSLALLSVALLGLGLAVARNRWRAVVLGGVFVGLAATLAAVAGVMVARSVAAGLVSVADKPAARRVADAIAQPFTEAMVVLGLVGVVVAVGGALGRRVRQSFG